MNNNLNPNFNVQSNIEKFAARKNYTIVSKKEKQLLLICNYDKCQKPSIYQKNSQVSTYEQDLNIQFQYLQQHKGIQYSQRSLHAKMITL